jgi:hypothetical protein
VKQNDAGLNGRGLIPGRSKDCHHIMSESRLRPIFYPTGTVGPHWVKWPEHGADYSSPSIAEVSSAWSFTSRDPLRS